jgi:uncharacterized protein DUF5907
MGARTRRHIRSHVVAYAAVFLSLAVVPALAATTAPKNSVTSKSIKDGQVKKPDIAKNAVDSARVADNALTGADINESSLTGVGGPAGGDLTGTFPNPQIAPGTVGTAELEDLSVTLSKLAEHAVSGDKVAHHTLTGANVAANSLTGSEIDESTLSGLPPTGAAGGDLTGTFPNPQIAAGVITDAKVAGANKDGAANVPSLRTLGPGALQAMPGNATPGGPPSGAAGGALAGSYPNPTLGVSGGPCPNGKALVNVSALAALTCAPGVYSGANFAVAPDPFPAITTGTSNTAFGQQTLLTNTTGSNNTALGRAALRDNVSGSFNTAVGDGAMVDRADTGQLNVAVGFAALRSNSAGTGNVAVGRETLDQNSGSFNTAIGWRAMLLNGGGGSDNVVIGRDALWGPAGNDNVAIGRETGAPGTNESVAIGHGAGADASGSNMIDIGNRGFAGDSGTIRIGTPATHTRAYIAGIRGTTLLNNAVPVLIDSTGQLGTVAATGRAGREDRDLPALVLDELRQQRRTIRALRAQGRRQQAQIDRLLSGK